MIPLPSNDTCQIHLIIGVRRCQLTGHVVLPSAVILVAVGKDQLALAVALVIDPFTRVNVAALTERAETLSLHNGD